MKVLRTINAIDPAYGGPVAALEQTLPSLVDAGVQISLCSPPPQTPAGVDVVRRLEAGGVRWEPVRRRLDSSSRRRLDSLSAAADVVHCHSVYNPITAYVSWRCRRIAKPVLIEPHGALTSYHMSQKRWKKLVYEHIVEAPSLAGAAAVLVSSSREAEQLGSAFDCTTIIVPRAVTGDVAKRVQGGGRPTDVGFMGRIAAKKQTHVAVDGYRRVQLLRPNDIGSFRLAGPRSALLEDLLNGQSWGPDCQYEGPLFGHSKWEFLADIDILCVPSLDESFGLIIAEAALAGCAVVASDQCGAVEFFTNNDDILVCEPTVAGVADGISRALEIGPDIVGQRAQNTAELKFHPVAVASELSDVYDRSIRGIP